MATTAATMLASAAVADDLLDRAIGQHRFGRYEAAQAYMHKSELDLRRLTKLLEASSFPDNEITPGSPEWNAVKIIGHFKYKPAVRVLARNIMVTDFSHGQSNEPKPILIGFPFALALTKMGIDAIPMMRFNLRDEPLDSPRLVFSCEIIQLAVGRENAKAILRDEIATYPEERQEVVNDLLERMPRHTQSPEQFRSRK